MQLERADEPSYLAGLNSAQRLAVEYGQEDPHACGPLLIIAGAGAAFTFDRVFRVRDA